MSRIIHEYIISRNQLKIKRVLRKSKRDLKL
jgi:hypothetical protein